MEDYEQTAIKSMEQLKEKHQMDQDSLVDEVTGTFKMKNGKNFKNKEIIDLQKQIEVLVSVNKLDEASRVKEILEMHQSMYLEEEQS